MKETVIKRLLQENKNLCQKCSDLENKLISTESYLNQLEQYGQRNNTVISGTPHVIKILADADIVIETSNIEACHRFASPIESIK